MRVIMLCMGLTATMSAGSASAQNVRGIEKTMRLSLDGPVAQTFPLFGPKRESEWAPGWQPKFLQPVDGAQGAEGAVFLTSGRDGDAVWVMSRYDQSAGAIDYVYVLAGRLVTRINIRLAAEAKRSLAVVTYRLTALGAEGEHLVDEFDRSFAARQAHWQEAINHLLRTGRPVDPHEPKAQ